MIHTIPTSGGGVEANLQNMQVYISAQECPAHHATYKVATCQLECVEHWYTNTGNATHADCSASAQLDITTTI